ncbi:serine protease family S33 [Thraustotheca clavata]|uniref:Serine protease family S33 n=1 Tax=Thraustotheca clavata TaxID=74557 RepID=A0A1V9Z393_9STRA|nr:serine protease family S33 [Thraustotheca clavata]
MIDAIAVILAALFGTYLVLHLFTSNRSKVELHYRSDSQINQFITQHAKLLSTKYHPPWWAINAHVQILMTLLVPQTKVKYNREILPMTDGGQIALDWCAGAEDFPDNVPVVIVVHGLTGCSYDMRSYCAEALEAGFRPVAFNKRGHGDTTLSSPKLQAFGCIQDLSQAIAHIKNKYPAAKLVGVGFSAGSGLVCSYLGETGANSKLSAAILVSPGYDALGLFCHGGIYPLYHFLMTFTLKGLLKRHKNVLSDAIDFDAAMNASSIPEFDKHVYMSMHGYDDLEEYWKHNNPMRQVNNIAVPTLCINARDDPVCTYGMIPFQGVFDSNPYAMLALTAHGSHCGFFELDGLEIKSWSTKVSLDYLKAALQYSS